MKKMNTLFTIIIGSIVLIATLLLFFFTVTLRDAQAWTAIAFLLLAEIIFFDGLLVVEYAAPKSEGPYLRVGCCSVLALYMAVTLAVSLVFLSVVHERHMGLLLSLNIAAIVITAVLFLIVFQTAGRIDKKNSRTDSSMENMWDLQDRAAVMAQEYGYGVFHTPLNDIADALRCCDLSSSVPTDKSVAEGLLKLEEMLRAAQSSASVKMADALSEASPEEKAAQAPTETDILDLTKNILTLMKQRKKILQNLS